MIDLYEPGPAPDPEFAAWQQVRAAAGDAENQCPGCGAFRLDGQPPTVHRHRCRMGPDGSRLPVLGRGTWHLDHGPVFNGPGKVVNHARYHPPR